MGSEMCIRDRSFFSEAATCACHHTSGRWLDALARLPNCAGQDADALSAYTQAELQGTETWVSLPADQWPTSWGNMYRPVCKFKLALYGHPKAGYYWQEHCKNALRRCGWEQVPSWESMFMHKTKQLFLSVYVDDFKMAGLAKNIRQAWAELGKHLELEPATVCLLYTSPSPRDGLLSRMPSSA